MYAPSNSLIVKAHYINLFAFTWMLHLRKVYMQRKAAITAKKAMYRV